MLVTHFLLFTYFDPLFSASIALPLNMGLLALSMLLYCCAACRNPGTLPSIDSNVFETKIASKMSLALDPSGVFDKFCPDCLAVKTERSRHCYVCDQCVARLDHHCPWLNNCVGARNHAFFLFFLLTLFLHLFWVLAEMGVVFVVNC